MTLKTYSAMSVIKLNNVVKNRIAILLQKRQEIDQRLNEDINLIVEANEMAGDGAKYSLSDDLSEIRVEYPVQED